MYIYIYGYVLFWLKVEIHTHTYKTVMEFSWLIIELNMMKFTLYFSKIFLILK